MDNSNQEKNKNASDLTSESVILPDIKNDNKSDIALSSASTINSKAPSLVKQAPKLTLKNRSFLEHLCAGKGTIEAYRLAGYKGTGHAAYQLRSQLKEQLKQELENQGFDRNGIKIRVKQLLDKGIDPEVTHLSPRLYLETMKFADKLMEHEKESDIKISPFLISTDSLTINEAKPI